MKIQTLTCQDVKAASPKTGRSSTGLSQRPTTLSPPTAAAKKPRVIGRVRRTGEISTPMTPGQIIPCIEGNPSLTCHQLIGPVPQQYHCTATGPDRLFAGGRNIPSVTSRINSRPHLQVVGVAWICGASATTGRISRRRVFSGTLRKATRKALRRCRSFRCSGSCPPPNPPVYEHAFSLPR